MKLLTPEQVRAEKTKRQREYEKTIESLKKEEARLIKSINEKREEELRLIKSINEKRGV